MNPPLGGSPEPHTNETHRVLLSPLVFCLTGALRETQHLGGYRRLGTPPRYPPPAMNRGRHHGAMRCRCHGFSRPRPGLRARSGIAPRLRRGFTRPGLAHHVRARTKPDARPRGKPRHRPIDAFRWPWRIPGYAHVDRPAFRTSDKRNGPSAWHAERRPPFNDASPLTAQSALPIILDERSTKQFEFPQEVRLHRVVPRHKGTSAQLHNGTFVP